MSGISRYAVFGHPIGHSLSPQLHALFGKQTGIALEYSAIDAPPESFAEIARVFFAEGGCGANVTLPHKRAAFKFADTRTDTAQRVGVANVLTKLADGKIEAHNTDGAGLIRDLTQRHQLDLHDRSVLLLGAGGAAQSVARALLNTGVRALILVNRTIERAQSLADSLSQPQRVCISTWDALPHCGASDLIVNATSAGVQGAALELPHSLVRSTTITYDLGYGKSARPFLDWAHDAGAMRAHDGLGMLVETAADSFEHWHGVRPDADAAYRELQDLQELAW